jgi:hypothetical protein
MRILKIIDLGCQALLLACFILYTCFFSKNGSFIYAYFIVGGWQILSFAIHAMIPNNLFFRKDRRSYGKTVLWLFIIGMLLFVGFTLGIIPPAGLTLVYPVALLIISPILAIMYFSICFGEIKLLYRKALIHLK